MTTTRTHRSAATPLGHLIWAVRVQTSFGGKPLHTWVCDGRLDGEPLEDRELRAILAELNLD